MKFSMMTYTMMRQGTYTPADCVRVAAELKMDGIDWVTTYGEDPKLLKKMSDDAGLPVAAFTFFIRGNTLAERKDIAERQLDNACTLGAPLVMIPPAPFAGVADPAENRNRWIEVLRDVAPLAEKR
ncbi:MAG: TIM barrel protein, partial [Lentisphaeria bacterium]|nr:TIM barrel protein [Lentisphaeria bacterium]